MLDCWTARNHATTAQHPDFCACDPVEPWQDIFLAASGVTGNGCFELRDLVMPSACVSLCISNGTDIQNDVPLQKLNVSAEQCLGPKSLTFEPLES